MKSHRYEIEGEVARGGMGAILRVWDEDLRRHLAMKVVVGAEDAPRTGGSGGIDARILTRFLEEAQVTGQLDHPGIVPVHELGLDANGRVYFTMKLVRGRDLRAIFDLVFAGKEGWNETRALGSILRVCEAMAYAHAKGVIHRDLKPANVMIGSFGEVFVMDWGLARVLGRKDAHDLRLRPEGGDDSGSGVSTVTTDLRGADSDSPLLTMDGDVVGTPAYMPPEQARGEIEQLSARSDVYSIGAMVYHLLARRAPYAAAGGRARNLEILDQVRRGPPAPLSQSRRDVPAELSAICEKAMARDPEGRYPDTIALAEDLRAYLEHRVVGAYETGAWAETRKWMQRNRALAGALAASMLLLVAGLLTSLVFRSQARAEARTATQRADDVLSLSAIQDLKDLEDRADALWPADPGMIAKYEAWLSDARVLIDGRAPDAASGSKKRPSLSEHEAKLAELRQRAKPPSSTEEAASPTPSDAHVYEFESSDDRWWHAQLSKLVSDLHALTDGASGGLLSSGVSEKHGWGIPKRVEFARTIAQRSTQGPEARARWDVAIASIAKNPKYGGLRLLPQLGLLPIGEDPDSHLWEFAHLATGDVPERGPDEKLILRESMGLVFVLIPGGVFEMGAQATDPNGPNYDGDAQPVESPVHEVELSPYFLSKYEMTQGQWERFTSRNPSTYGPGIWQTTFNREGKGWTSLHPVEQVNWTQCTEVMARLGLALPSEAQWECGARAGTHTKFWTGASPETIQGAANVADAYGKSHGADAWSSWSKEIDDGNTVHAEVGSFRANPFGLHDVHGNVWEWCSDGFDETFYAHSPRLDPVGPLSGHALRVLRGGSFFDAAVTGRIAFRNNDAPELTSYELGLRPARAVTR